MFWVEKSLSPPLLQDLIEVHLGRALINQNADSLTMSALPSDADIRASVRQVCSVPISDVRKVIARRPQAMGALLVSIRLRKLSIGCRASIAGMLSRALTFEHQGYGKAASHCIIGFDPSAGSTHITSMSIASFFTR